MGGGSPKTQTVRNVTEIDPVTQQWRQTLMNAGGALYNQGAPGYYPGQTVTPFSNQTQAGLDYLQSYAMQGAPNLGMANAANARAMSGFNPAMPYANSWASGQNPLLQNVLSASSQQVAPQVSGMIQNAANASNPYMSNIAAAGSASNPMAGAGTSAGLNLINQSAASNPLFGQSTSAGLDLISQGAGANPLLGARTTQGVDALQGFSNASNPHLRGLFDQGAAQVSDAVNANFARAGRYGANAAHTGALSRELGNLYNNIYAPAYEASQGRALQAAGQLAGLEQADYARNAALYDSGAGRAMQAGGQLAGLQQSDMARNASLFDAGAGRAFQAGGQLAGLQQSDMARNAALGESALDRNASAAGQLAGLFEQQAGRGFTGAGLLADVSSQDAQRRLTGASQAAGYGMQGADLFGGLFSQGNQDAARAIALQPGLYSYGQMPGQSMLDVGGIYENQAQRYIDADRGRYEYTANAPWQQLQNYAQLMSGLPDFSGSSQTSPVPQTNRIMSGLGGALAGGSAMSALGLAGKGAMFGPYGALIGGGLGLLGGLFG